MVLQKRGVDSLPVRGIQFGIALLSLMAAIASAKFPTECGLSTFSMISRTCLRRVVLIGLFDVDCASGASFWSNCVKGRGRLAVYEGVEPPGEGEHTWRYSKGIYQRFD